MGMVTKVHELLSNVKFGRFLLRYMEDIKFLHFCYIEYGQPCLNGAECPSMVLYIYSVTVKVGKEPGCINNKLKLWSFPFITNQNIMFQVLLWVQIPVR